MTTRRQESRLTVPARYRQLCLLPFLAALVSCGGGGSGGGNTDSAGLDPLVEDYGIAYVKQSVPEEDTADVREVTAFNQGSDLYFRDLASPGARERNITRSVTDGLGDVKDVEVSFDGSKLLFALHLPEIEGAAPEDQPTWNIWEYEIATDTLQRVIVSDINAEAGQDVAPHYLPDGRIIFSSTRQRTSKALLLDEGKPQFSALDENRNEPAVVLHVMDADGTNIQQVSYNQSHDLDPVVLQSGEVVFSRWDNAGNNSGVHLYKMNPDGSKLQLLYGANSHDTGTDGATIQFTQAREMPDGGIAVLVKPFTGNYQGGDILTIDVDNYVEDQQALGQNLGILTGPAQESTTFGEVRTDDQPSPGGRFISFFPLWDGTERALVSWSQCRLMDGDRIVPCLGADLTDPNIIEAPPLYSVFIYDLSNQTQIPVFTPEEGVIYRDVVAAQPRILPDIIFDLTPGVDVDQILVDENAGILNIRSVYDFDGTYNALGGNAADIATLADPQQTTSAAQRPARFLRLVKAVSLPDRDLVNLPGSAFGRAGRFMSEIVGYAPIEPDGSVRMKVPANVPFAVSVLDADGKRITARHQNWLQVRPGEELRCHGCHDASTGLSHGRRDAFLPLNTGAPFDGYVFPNTETFFADTGETMAEARTRIDATALNPSMDIHFEDVWTNEAAAGRAKDASFDYEYAVLNSLNPPLPAPVSDACQNNWNSLCRTVINYERNIHPLWSVDRGAGTCISCHSNTDDMGLAMVPAGQLDLTDGVSDQDPDHFKSYQELLFNDEEEILNDMGQLVVREEPATTPPLFVLDANGDPVLDADGNPIPRLVRFPVAPSMRGAGALASGRFFDRFSDPADADHFATLSPAELKLLAEWLDIGNQYYNNPFDVPQ